MTYDLSFWLVTPDGTRTRARVYDDAEGDVAAYRLDAVEKPLRSSPRCRSSPRPK